MTSRFVIYRTLGMKIVHKSMGTSYVLYYLLSAWAEAFSEEARLHFRVILIERTFCSEQNEMFLCINKWKKL